MTQLQRTVDGFEKWCDEFIAQVIDHSGESIYMDFQEQLGFLKDRATPRGVEMPDITNDEDLASVLDELRYRIKGGKYNARGRSLTEDFDSILYQFIRDYGLDKDPHTLAALPPEPVDPPHYPGELRKFYESIREEVGMQGNDCMAVFEEVKRQLSARTYVEVTGEPLPGDYVVVEGEFQYVKREP
jgi:hypothetical protein